MLINSQLSRQFIESLENVEQTLNNLEMNIDPELLKHFIDSFKQVIEKLYNIHLSGLKEIEDEQIKKQTSQKQKGININEGSSVAAPRGKKQVPGKAKAKEMAPVKLRPILPKPNFDNYSASGTPYYAQPLNMVPGTFFYAQPPLMGQHYAQPPPTAYGQHPFAQNLFPFGTNPSYHPFFTEPGMPYNPQTGVEGSSEHPVHIHDDQSEQPQEDEEIQGGSNARDRGVRGRGNRGYIFRRDQGPGGSGTK